MAHPQTCHCLSNQVLARDDFAIGEDILSIFFSVLKISWVLTRWTPKLPPKSEVKGHIDSGFKTVLELPAAWDHLVSD